MAEVAVRRPDTVVTAAPGDGQAAALAALAFGSHAGLTGVAGGKHLAFLPVEALELDLADPEQRDFGDYELVEQLGQGGMGVVYRARQRSLQREVALKLLSAGPWASQDFIERFRREAQSAARLQHPNIVSIYEIGQHAELNFFTMALVRGASLAERLDRGGPLAPRDAARLVRTIAEALDYAHRLGILHLDLKPANILIDEHGEPQVADFGLAKRLDESLASDSDEVSGTPSYMAPEQATARSQRIGVGTDIYGLGAILYELLCGRPPFIAATPRQTLEQVATQAVASPRVHRADLPADLEAVCLKCLAKDPADRYLSARGLAEDLGRFLDGRQVSVRPLHAGQRLARWARREPRVALAAAAAVLALLVGLVATSLQWRRAERQTELAEASAAEVRETLWQRRVESARTLLGAARSAEAVPELVQNLAEQEANGATDAAALTRLRIASALAETPALVDAFSVGVLINQLLVDPAGDWFAITDGTASAVQLHDLATGERRWRAELTPGMAGAIEASSDPRWLFARAYNQNFSMPYAVMTTLVDVRTGTVHAPPLPRLWKAHYTEDARFVLAVQHAEASGEPPLGRLLRVSDWTVQGAARALPGAVQLSPDGAHFAYRAVMTDDTGQDVPIELVDARSMQTRWRFLPPAGVYPRAWTFTADGASLLLGFSDGRTGVFDVASGRVEWLQGGGGSSVLSLGWSQESDWLAVGYAEGALAVFDFASRALVTPLLRLDEQGGGETEVALSSRLRLLYAPGFQRGRLWSLPASGPARLLFDRPPYPRVVQGFGSDAVLDAGVIAEGAADGRVRVWRFTPRNALPGQAPPREMAAPGRHEPLDLVPMVEGARVRLVDRLAPAASPAPTLAFDQPVGFVERVPGGDALLISAGHHLHLRNGRSGEALAAPLALPASPVAVLVAPDGGDAIVAWSSIEGGRSGLRLRSIGVDDGATLAEQWLERAAWQLAHSDDGRTLLAYRAGAGILQVRDAKTLVLRWERRFPQAGAFDPIRSLRIGRDGAWLWVATGAGRAEGYRLHRLRVSDGAAAEVRQLPVWPPVLQPFAGGLSVAAVFPQRRELRIWHRDGREQRLPVGELPRGGLGGLAISADERRLVVALEHGVQWVDVATGEWISPALMAAGEAPFASLRIDPAGTTALWRDAERRAHRFTLPDETRPVETLQTLAALLVPGDQDQPYAPEVAPELRRDLRAADPGPPAPPPPPVVAAALMRPPADAAFVDLAPHCSRSFEDAHRQLHFALRLDRMLVPGPQRLLGVDYFLQCMVQATYSPDSAPSVARGSRVEGIRVRAPAARLHLLMMAATGLLDEGEDHYATIELRYADGSRARIPVRLRQHLTPWFEPDPDGSLAHLPVAYAGAGVQFFEALYVVPVVYAVPIEVPHPERGLQSFALEATEHAWSAPVLLAASVEAP